MDALTPGEPPAAVLAVATPGGDPRRLGVDPRRAEALARLVALEDRSQKQAEELTRLGGEVARLAGALRDALDARSVGRGLPAGAVLETAELKAQLDRAVAERLRQAEEAHARSEGPEIRNPGTWSVKVRAEMRAKALAGDRAELDAATRDADAHAARAAAALDAEKRREETRARAEEERKRAFAREDRKQEIGLEAYYAELDELANAKASA